MVEELVHVLPLSSPNPPHTLRDVWDVTTAKQTREDIKKPTLLYCSGLVEVVETGWSFYIVKGEDIGYRFTTQVQFIHQCDRDYLNSTKTQKELAVMLGPTPPQLSLY